MRPQPVEEPVGKIEIPPGDEDVRRVIRLDIGRIGLIGNAEGVLDGRKLHHAREYKPWGRAARPREEGRGA